MEIPEQNPLNSGIVPQDSHMRKPGEYPRRESKPGSPWWRSERSEASGECTEGERRQGIVNRACVAETRDSSPGRSVEVGKEGRRNGKGGEIEKDGRKRLINSCRPTEQTDELEVKTFPLFRSRTGSYDLRKSTLLAPKKRLVDNIPCSNPPPLSEITPCECWDDLLLPGVGGGRAVRLLASHQGANRTQSPAHVEIVPDDYSGRRVFSGISRFPPPLHSLLHFHLISPSSALKTSFLRAAQISKLSLTVGYGRFFPRSFFCEQLVPPLMTSLSTTQNTREIITSLSYPGFRVCHEVRELSAKTSIEPGLDLVGTTVAQWFERFQVGPQWPGGYSDSKWGRNGSVDRTISSGATVAKPEARNASLAALFVTGAVNQKNSLGVWSQRPQLCSALKEQNHKCRSAEKAGSAAAASPGLRTGGRGGVVVRLIASHQAEPDQIPGGVDPPPPRFLHVGTAPDDAAGYRVFSEISHFPRPCIPDLLHSRLTSPLSALNTSMLRPAGTSSLIHSHLRSGRKFFERGHSCEGIACTTIFEELWRGGGYLLRLLIVRVECAPAVSTQQEFAVLLSDVECAALSVSKPDLLEIHFGFIGLPKLILNITNASRAEMFNGSKNKAIGHLRSKRAQLPVGRSRILACRNRAVQCRWSAGFLGDLPFPSPPHSGAAPYSPRFTLTTRLPPRRARFYSRRGRSRVFCMWESCRTISLVGGVFSGISRFTLPLYFEAAQYSHHFTLIGSQDLDVKSHRNLSTPFQNNCDHEYRAYEKITYLQHMHSDIKSGMNSRGNPASKVKEFCRGGGGGDRYGRHYHARLVPHRSYAQGVQCFRSGFRTTRRTHIDRPTDGKRCTLPAARWPSDVSCKHGRVCRVGSPRVERVCVWVLNFTTQPSPEKFDSGYNSFRIHGHAPYGAMECVLNVCYTHGAAANKMADTRVTNLKPLKHHIATWPTTCLMECARLAMGTPLTHLGEVAACARLAMGTPLTHLGEVAACARLAMGTPLTHLGEVAVCARLAMDTHLTHLGEVAACARLAMGTPLTHFGEVAACARLAMDTHLTHLGEVAACARLAMGTPLTHLGEVAACARLTMGTHLTHLGEVAACARLAMDTHLIHLGNVAACARLAMGTPLTHLGEVAACARLAMDTHLTHLGEVAACARLAMGHTSYPFRLAMGTPLTHLGEVAACARFVMGTPLTHLGEVAACARLAMDTHLTHLGEVAACARLTMGTPLTHLAKPSWNAHAMTQRRRADIVRTCAPGLNPHLAHHHTSSARISS
ncbi:hypothetical protein PR048_023958 [Dryococelus australis]|uniref:Uncharacterized protein n=1 Tax=Dryococelus australis TaxID=614101 RepID=A0ABQ9GVJ1_9NEOP|nr:hypothetical protein PR048_023958 [Dryococelus australis]